MAWDCLSNCRPMSCISETDFKHPQSSFMCLCAFPSSCAQSTQIGFANLEPPALVWKWTMSALWQPRLGSPIPQRWYPRGVHVFARWFWKRLVFRVGVRCNSYKGTLYRSGFSWAWDSCVKSFCWISQNSSKSQKVSLSLKKSLSLLSHLYFHDKNQQFQAVALWYAFRKAFK